MPGPAVTSPDRTSRTLWPWLVAVAALVVMRALPYVVWGTLAFDADQAVVGLMAKHVAEFRAVPVYQYGLPYIVILTAYLVAPFMWLFGATVFALKFPLMLLNVGVGVGLVAAVARSGVAPILAFLVCLPVVMPSGLAGAGLMDALGMTIEPLAFILALWYLRAAPVAFGCVAAFGFHVREFVAYGVAAALVVDVLSSGLTSREARHRWFLIVTAALGTTALLGGVARFGSVRGPGTWLTADLEGNLSTLGGAFCFVPAQAWSNVLELGRSYLGLLWGAEPAPLSTAAVNSRVVQGVPGLWAPFGGALLVAMAGLALRWRGLWARRHHASVQLGGYLALVGAQAVLVYAVSRCTPVSTVTIRYALLGVFLPIGLAVLVWAVDGARAIRVSLATAFVVLAAVNARTHWQLWHERLTDPVVPPRALLGPALEARGIRYAHSDYWTAYYVTFLTQERVVVHADSLGRIDAYEQMVMLHRDAVVRLSTEPCGDVPAIVPGYYACP